MKSMSYVIPYEDVSQSVESVQPAMRYIPRSAYVWVPFIIPVLFCGLSYLSGGSPFFTDLGFITLTILCAGFLLMEVVRFPFRAGLGGILLFGGVLSWFCNDYLTTWLGMNFAGGNSPIPALIVAKSAFWHSVFILMMVVGLNIKYGKWLEKSLLCLPDIPSESFFVVLILGLFLVGISPFFLFSAESPIMCFIHYGFGSWTGGAPAFTVSRTGSVNYSFGAYVAQILQIGTMSGLLSLIYAVLVAQRPLPKLLAWLNWTYWTFAAFETVRRGELSAMMLPAIILIFLKYQMKAAALYGRHSVRAYIYGGFLLFMLVFGIAFLGQFRGERGGLGSGTIGDTKLSSVSGNHMFTEGLIGFQLIPETHDFFRAANPVEGLLLPMPNTAYWFVIGIMPRAVWTSKPLDDTWVWYNETVTHEHNIQGTTISHGLVGYWYFNFGPFGVLEGGLYAGWLMIVAERTLQHSEGKPLNLLMALGFAAFLVREYRDVNFSELYPLIIGGVAIAATIYALRPFFGGTPQTTT
jgi:hypothetical protein